MSGFMQEVPEEFPIEGNKFTIGRARDCSFVITDMAISRLHCTLEKADDDKWSIIDTSSNGILLNGDSIKKNTKIDLQNGCYITLTDKIYYAFENIPENPNDVASPMKAKLKRVLHPIELDENVINLCDDSIMDVVADEPVTNNVPNPSNNCAVQSLDKNVLPAPTEGTASPPKEATAQNNSVNNAPRTVNKPSVSSKDNSADDMDPMREELTCSICAEIFINAKLLDCKHTFCGYCIDMWRKSQNVCPICRAKITRDPVASLVIDNCCNAVMMKMSKEEQDRREENIKLRTAEVEKANSKKGAQKTARGRGRSRGRGRQSTSAATRASTRRNQNVMVSIEISSSSDTDFDDDEEDYFDSDDWNSMSDVLYMVSEFGGPGYTGIPGRYYGGYGRCYKCHQPGHWSNGCPNR